MGVIAFYTGRNIKFHLQLSRYSGINFTKLPGLGSGIEGECAKSFARTSVCFCKERGGDAGIRLLW